MKSNWTPRVALGAVLFLLLSACGVTPPSALEDSLKALPGQIQDVRGTIDKNQTAFNTKLGDSKFAPFRAYSPSQLHADRFDQARGKLNEADGALKTADAVVDNYTEARQSELEGIVKQVNSLKDEASRLSGDPLPWLDKVAGVKADPAGTVRQATKQTQDLKTAYDPLKGQVDTAQKAYPATARSSGTSSGR